MKPRGRTNSQGVQAHAWYHLFVREISPGVLLYVVYIEKSQTGPPPGTVIGGHCLLRTALRAASHSSAAQRASAGPRWGGTELFRNELLTYC